MTNTTLARISMHLQHRYGMLCAALIGLALGASVSSCSNMTDSSEPDGYTATAESILSTDSTMLPDDCMRRPDDFLKTKLNLTDDQVAQIKVIQDSTRAEAKAKIEAAASDRALVRAILEDYRKILHDRINAVLTDEQRATLEANRPPERDHMLPSLEQDSIMLARMTTDLGLSADQVSQIVALRDALRADTTNQHPHESFYLGLQQILTADQLTKLQQMHPPFMGRGRGHGPHGDGDRRGGHRH